MNFGEKQMKSMITYYVVNKPINNIFDRPPCTQLLLNFEHLSVQIDSRSKRTGQEKSHRSFGNAD